MTITETEPMVAVRIRVEVPSNELLPISVRIHHITHLLERATLNEVDRVEACRITYRNPLELVIAAASALLPDPGSPLTTTSTPSIMTDQHDAETVLRPPRRSLLARRFCG